MTVEALWFDLGQTMRRIRAGSELSLGRAALTSGWSKGTLSQVEMGKARPSRELVDWYDTFFGCHGMLLAIYAEARAAGSSARPAPRTGPDGTHSTDSTDSTGSTDGAHGPDSPAPTAYPVPEDDILLVAEHGLAHGQLVTLSEELEIVWTLRNCGTVAWRDRWMARLGPYAGGRVVSSERRTRIPDAGPGETVEVRCALRAPYTGGTFIAYWKMADADDAYCFPQYSPVSVLIVVEQPLFDPRDGTAVETMPAAQRAGVR